jgi:tetratricopeptide (TPR) repeat protein
MNRHRLSDIKKSTLCGRLLPVIVLSGALACEPSIALSPLSETIDALAARAEQFETEAKWDQAAGAYQEILRIDPRSVAALNRLGALYIRQENYREGLKYYQQALQLNPKEFGSNLT